MPIISVGLSLAVILILLRHKVSIALAMFIGALISGFGSGLNIAEFIEAGRLVLLDFATWELAATIAFISALGKIMNRVGILEALVDSLQKLFKDTRYILIALPSLVSMLMVPGGAIMSAPLVEEVGARKNLSIAKMTIINMMYRHVWFLVFPLFPSMILAAQIANVSPTQIIAFNFPLAVVAFLVSFKVLFSGEKKLANPDYKGWDRQAFRQLLKAVLPMITAVFLALVVGIRFPIAVFLGLFVVYFYQRQEEDLLFSRFLHWIFTGINWVLVLSIFAIMLFKEVLAAGGAVEMIAVFFLDRGTSLLLLTALVPFIAGFVTGNNAANIAISFPLFVPLLPEETFVYYVGFMYTMSVIGYLISPIHLCYILTRDFFKCALTPAYRIFLIPTTAMALVAALMILLLT